MKKIITIATVILLVTGCRGTRKPPAPLSFPPAAENRLRYRFAVPPPKSIEKGPFTLYGRKIGIQKRTIRAIDAYGRFSTCVVIPHKEAGTVAGELKYARKRGANFLLRTDITLFEASFKGRNARVMIAYPLAFTFFGLPLAWDVDAKTWIGEGIMEIKVLECSSGNQIYSSTVKADALFNFSRYEEMKEREFGKNYIRYTLGKVVLNNLMVGLIEELNENFARSLVGHVEEAPDKTPTETPPPVEE